MSENRVLVLCLLTLAGCATLDESECKTADWRDLGYRDGLSGYTQSRLAQHYESCKKHGVYPNELNYAAGRTAGLGEYCRIENAIAIGRAGRRYEDVCPPGFTNASLN